MPCCTFDKRPDSFHPLGIFFVCGVLLLLGAPLGWLLLGLGQVVPPLSRAGRKVLALVTASRQVVATDFLHPRYRCSLSARLLDRSPRLAGLVYRHLNLAALLCLWLGAASLVSTAVVLVR